MGVGEKSKGIKDGRSRGEGKTSVLEMEVKALSDQLEKVNAELERKMEGLKQAEGRIRQVDDEWERTFDSVPDLVAIMDDQHRIVRINRAMAERLGVDAKHCIGKLCYHSVHCTDHPPDICPHLLTLDDGLEHAAELHDEKLGGYFLVTTTPLLNEEGRRIGSVHVARDITERKQAEESLRIAKEAAEAANRTKSLFLANMSHELRTPLTGLLGMLDIVLATPLDERQKETIDLARISGQALLKIINDVLDLSRIESGKLNIEEKPFLLRDCVSLPVEILMPEARRKGLGLEWAVSGDISDTVVGDRVRIQQVLTNLIGNAVKFTEKGKVSVLITSDGRPRDGWRDIRFTVRDTGIGIPEEKREIIFRTFCQADESHTRQYGGTGLGLSISRELVNLMGGAIACESTEGDGSSFSFTIPLREAVDETAEKIEEEGPLDIDAAVSLAGKGKRARLLVAEDDEVTRKVLGFMLGQTGFDFAFARDGLQVVEMWEKGDYDLIVMDGQMPRMDGFTAARTIRERERDRGGHIPIVAMTAHALKEDEERCLAAGMDAYVSKPIDFRKFLEVIGGVLDQGETQGRG